MKENYHVLSFGRDTWLKKKSKGNPMRLGLLLIMMFFASFTFAQVTVPAANTNTGSARYPLASYYGYERAAMIYTSAQIGATGSISSVGFYVNSVSSPGNDTDVRIYMKLRTTLMTANTTYASEISGATLVYGPTNIPASSFVAGGWITIPLDTPFDYTGGANHLEIIIETNSGGTGSGEDSDSKQFRYSNPGANHFQYWQTDNSPSTGPGARNSNRPNVQLGFGPPPTCTAPSALNATAIGLDTATLNWTCASCTGTYRVEYNTAPATFGGVGNIVIDPATSGAVISGLTAATNYTFFVRQDCGGGDLSTVSSTTFTTSTPGESCDTAATLAVAPNQGAAVNTLLTTGLTSDGPAGTCSDGTGNPSKKDRWVKFVAPTSGNKVVIVTSAGTLTDAVMQVWSDCPATGTAMGCNDDATSSILMPKMEFCASQYTPGATYYVQVWPYGSSTSGTFNIQIYEDTACPLPPSNDECAGATTLTIGAAGSCPGAAVTGTTVDATASAGVVKTTCDQFGTYLDVFYKFNSGSYTEMALNFTSLTGTCEFGIYSACGSTYLGVCSSSSPYSNTITGMTPNTDYTIIVWSNTGATGTFSLCLAALPVPGCVSAPTAPANAGSTCANTINFSWPAVSGATAYDVYIDSVLVSDNQTATSYSQAVSVGAHTWSVVPSNSSGEATGCSDFTFTRLASPPGDTFATAIDLGVITSSTSVDGNNLPSNCWNNDYTTTSTPGNPGNARPGYDVFYQFTITECGSSLNIGTCVSNFDTIIHILDSTGTRINGDDDSCVAPGNEPGSLASGLSLAAGTYYVVVEGYNTGDSGTFTLDFAYTPGTVIPSQPTLACYESATFNNTTCVWDVTGTQPAQPTLACYETATFNDATCSWDVTGTQPTLGSVTTSAAGSYTWPLPYGTGLTYTVSGIYTNTVDCNIATLDLTIIPTVNTFNIGTSCGATVSSLAVTVTAAPVPGTSAYTFRITNMNTSAVFVISRPVNSFALGNYVGVTLGTQYQVEVSTNGGANYGTPCIINTPTPVSDIGAQCGTTLTSMSQFVYATYSSTVSGYRFRITNPVTSTSVVYDALSSQNRFSFSQLPAAFVSFGTTYSVQVALRNTDGTYLPYGSGCDITTPAFPTSEVILSQCDMVATNNTQMINAVVVSGATNYRFELVNSSLSYNFSIDRALNTFNLSMFPGLTPGTTYTVHVAVRIGGVWGPLTGKACNLTTPGIAPSTIRTIAENDKFIAIAYPNPFAENFMFDVQTTAENTIQVRVYDMLGKQVENRNVEASDINALQFGDAYPSGVYNVIVSQGENTQTLRVIKR